MNLTKRILNHQAIASLYEDKERLPIDNAEIVELQVKRDEPRLIIRLMTSSKPTSPPARWPKNYDVVYIDISFIGVKNLLIRDWGSDNTIVKFDMNNDDNAAYVKIFCQSNTVIIFACDWVRIEGVKYGYVGSL